MKMKKILAAAAAAALAASALSVAAFADIDYTEVAEANKGLYFKASAGWAGGQWIVGNDNTVMDDALTYEDLKNADHFEIYYTATETPPTLTEGDTAKLTFIYKVVTGEDEEKKPNAFEAYLPEGWVQYGPTTPEDGSEPQYAWGHSYLSLDNFSFDVEEEGVLIINTADILKTLKIEESEFMYICQFGIGCNTYDYDSDWADEADLGADYEINISKVLLCDEPTDASIGAQTSEETTAEDTTAEETTAEVTTAATTAGTTAAATTAAATTAANASGTLFGLSTVMLIAIAGGVVVLAGVAVLVVVLMKKKK